MLPSPLLLSPCILLAFTQAYYSLSPCFKTEKQRAYVLSALSSCTMTLLSLPFVWTYLSQGLPVLWSDGQSGWMEYVARFGCTFFGCYLFADLAIGYFKYPSQVGLLTGWIHHTCYLALMVYCLNSGAASLFLAAGIMELPTFDLAISTLFPRIRQDLRFLVTFCLLRILLHLHLLVTCAAPAGRAITDGSYVPTAMFALSGLLHVMWFQGGVKGYLKRQRSKTTGDAIVNAAAQVDRTVMDNLSPTTPGSGTQTPDDSPLVTPRTPSTTSVHQQNGFVFPPLPNLSMLPMPAMPTLPAVHIPKIPTMHELTAKLNAEAIRAEWRGRWEEQRGRFRGGRGGLGLRRRGMIWALGGGAGEGDEVLVEVREVQVEDD